MTKWQLHISNAGKLENKSAHARGARLLAVLFSIYARGRVTVDRRRGRPRTHGSPSRRSHGRVGWVGIISRWSRSVGSARTVKTADLPFHARACTTAAWRFAGDRDHWRPPAYSPHGTGRPQISQQEPRGQSRLPERQWLLRESTATSIRPTSALAPPLLEKARADLAAAFFSGQGPRAFAASKMNSGLVARRRVNYWRRNGMVCRCGMFETEGAKKRF